MYNRHVVEHLIFADRPSGIHLRTNRPDGRRRVCNGWIQTAGTQRHVFFQPKIVVLIVHYARISVREEWPKRQSQLSMRGACPLLPSPNTIFATQTNFSTASTSPPNIIEDRLQHTRLLRKDASYEGFLHMAKALLIAAW